MYIKKKNSWLEKASKILGFIGLMFSVSAAIGIIWGGWLTFTYLSNIGFLSVFGEAISSPKSLIAILVVLGMVLFLIYFSFATPCFIFTFWNEFKQSPPQLNYFRTQWGFKKSVPLLFWNLITPIFFYMIFIIMLWSDNFSEKTMTLFFWLIVVLTPVGQMFCWHYFISKPDNKSFWKQWRLWLPFSFMICLFLSIFLSFYPLLLYIMLATWIPEGNIQYIFLFLTGIFLCLNLFFITSYASSYHEDKKYKYFISPFVFTVSTLIIIVVLVNNFPLHLFSLIRFAEQPQNASWYLLHDDFQKNVGTRKHDSIEKDDLSRLKQTFTQPKPRSKANLRHNALYGYMAWNLGDTKIFCPVTADNTKVKDDTSNPKLKTSLPEQCLIIRGQLLQPIPESYIVPQ